MAATVLSLMVLTALALVGGAWWLWRYRRAGRQALLMLLLAAIFAMNVAIWAIPNEQGATLVSAVPEQ
jgi:drug/metabolite transporter superfamily protein YnfA